MFLCEMGLIFNVLIANNSQMTFILRHFIINPKTKLFIPCDQTNNINSDRRGSSHITFDLTSAKNTIKD